MDEERGRLQPPAEAVRLEQPIGRGIRGFLAFLVCGAVLVAVFAVGWLWLGARKGAGGTVAGTDSTAEDSASGSAPETSGEAVTEPLPADAIPIRSADLSGSVELLNETSYTPDPAALRALIGGEPRSFSPEQPVVLILHTHAQEAYLAQPADYLTGPLGDAIYTLDPDRSVIAAGEALCRELTRNGVPAIHCTDLHGEGGTLRGAYRSAADCIAAYLEQYPSIAYVIDLHRDGIVASDGACLRTETPGNGTAQIQMVVGSDGNGTECPAWRSNLGLALCLRDRLNAEIPASCRPVVLRNASYNQEIAPHSLLLEIGSSGNTVSEAIAAAERAGRLLAALICNRPADGA